MRAYDRELPLIFIHIPKAGGTSVQTLFKAWYGASIYFNYPHRSHRTLPKRLDVSPLQANGSEVVVYGHFNRSRQFGIEDLFPEVRQFITILRDPFETAVSRYYYGRRVAARLNDPSRDPGASLAEYLFMTPSQILNHFPRPVTRDNFKQQIESLFIHAGTFEELDLSVTNIARKLGKPPPTTPLPHLNASPRADAAYLQLRQSWVEQHALEYEVYEYVRRRNLDEGYDSVSPSGSEDGRSATR